MMCNSTVRIAVGLRLDAPIVSTHVCVRGKTVTVDRHHGLSCHFGSGRHSRHNQVNDLLCRAFISTGTLATGDSHSLIVCWLVVCLTARQHIKVNLCQEQLSRLMMANEIAFLVHETQQAAGWREAGTMEKGSVPHLGCYLSGG